MGILPMVSVFMDVEDPVNPAADDAALDFARLFTEHGVPGSFCVTGEKCRTLLERGRSDVIEALSPHCLGLHTDTHSVHPTTMELLAPLAYDDGCNAALEAERRGLEAFGRAFGRTPAFWGGAGNTWSPEIPYALRHLDIPAYAYALTEAPGKAPHRFDGLWALPQHLSISEEQWLDPDLARSATDTCLLNLKGPWTAIFVGHPTRFRHARFWDAPYAGGINPPNMEPAPMVGVDLYVSAKRRVGEFLDRLRQVATSVTVHELVTSSWRLSSPSKEEQSYFREHTAANLRSAARWPIHAPTLDVENIVSKTLSLTHTVELATLVRH